MSQIRKRLRGKENIGEDIKDEKESNVNRTTQRKSPIDSLRILSRMAVIFSLLIIVYFTAKDEKLKTFAKQSEVLTGKGFVIECSPDYLKEINQYSGCVPRECSRFVTDQIVSASEVTELLEIAKKGLKLGGSSGGASILDLHSGALSMGQHFVNFYKTDQGKNVYTESDFNIYRVVKEKIKYAVAQHFGLTPDKIYLTHPTFFSQITSKAPVTVHDEYWHPHKFSPFFPIDKDTYKSFHYTTLLYLSDYNKDFEGGRFVFIDEKLNRTVEPRKGRVSMFTSGKENLHYVEKVKSGTRYAMTISFTCDKSFGIEDPSINKYH